MKAAISLVILLLFSPITFSQTSKNKFKVGDVLTSKINNVEILKSPDESSEILMKINKDEEIIYLGEDNNTYSKIKIKNVDGWIDSTFLVLSKNSIIANKTSIRKIDQWNLIANTLINEKINNSNTIKIISDNGELKDVLLGEARFLIYKGAALI